MEKTLLIIAHIDEYYDDISKCNNFTSAITFNIKKQLQELGVKCHVVLGMPWLGAVKVQKSFYHDFDRLFDKQLLDKFENILIIGANPLKKTNLNILNFLKQNVKHKLMYMSELPNILNDILNFYSMPTDNLGNQKNIFIGPMFNSEYLYPEKQYNNLIIHIDHHYQGRSDCFSQIVKLINGLKHNQYFQTYWNNFEIYYHGLKLEDITDFDFYIRPPNIPYSELTAIYRKCHVGFISHRETLGMYPIEMAAAGAIPILLDDLFLPIPMQKIVNCFSCKENFWDTLLPKINKDTAYKTSYDMKDYSYASGIKKIYREL